MSKTLCQEVCHLHFAFLWLLIEGSKDSISCFTICKTEAVRRSWRPRQRKSTPSLSKTSKKVYRPPRWDTAEPRSTSSLHKHRKYICRLLGEGRRLAEGIVWARQDGYGSFRREEEINAQPPPQIFRDGLKHRSLCHHTQRSEAERDKKQALCELSLPNTSRDETKFHAWIRAGDHRRQRETL